MMPLYNIYPDSDSDNQINLDNHDNNQQLDCYQVLVGIQKYPFMDG